MAATGYTSGDPHKVNRSGDSMTGQLLLSGDPIADQAAATRAFVLANSGDSEVAIGAAIAVHAAAADPHGDRAAAAFALAAHEADTTNVHGVADTALLETTTGSAAKVAAHAAASDPHGDRAFTTSAVAAHTAASDPHGDRAFATSAVATHAAASDPHGDRAFATTAVSTHEADTTAVHGIADTSLLETTTGSTAKVAAHTAASDPHGDRAFSIQRTNHTGTQSADTLTDGTTNKAFTATERTKLTGIATGATANSSDATLLARANHTGTQSADTITDGTTNKAYTATEKTKLSGIATAATANSSDATLLARANHTGTQLASTVSDFDTQVRLSRLDQLATAGAAVSFGGFRATLLADPTSAQDAATKQYVDDTAAGRKGAGFNQYRPADYGWLAWTQDPKTVATTSATLTSGTFYLIRIPCRYATAITNAVFISPTIGSSPTTVEASLFTSDGTRRAISANAAAAWTASGLKTVAFGSPYTPAAGTDWLWLGLIVVGGSVNLVRASSVSSQILNPNLTAATAAFATAGTALSATPAGPITPASNTLAATGEGWWGGLS